MEDRTGEPVTLTPYPDGPLVLRGEFELRDLDGAVVETRRGPVALCRCGHSALKPFCDGTHKVTGFRAPPGRPDTSASAPPG